MNNFQQYMHIQIIQLFLQNISIREYVFMLRLLLIILFVSSINCDCPIWPYPRQTVVGQIDIEVNYDQKLDSKPIESNYPLKDPFQENGISVAIAVQGFQLNSPNGLNFFVQNLPVTQTNLLKFRTQISGSSSWRILSFAFLATQSPLFLISTFTANQFSTGGQPGRYSIYRPIINFNSYLASPVIQVFLNGLQLRSKPLDQEYNTMLRQYQTFKKFSTNQRLITSYQQALQTKKSLTFNITGVKIISKLFTLTIESNSQLRSIRFSSVLFSKVNLSEKHSYIMNDFILSNGNQYRFTGLTNMGMVFTGLLGFKLPRNQRYKNNLIFQNFQGQSSFDVQTNIKYFSLGYTFLALQMKQKFVCDDCKDSPYIYDDKFCVGICPRSYSIMRRLDNIYCQKCDIEQLKVVDLISGQCVCAKRHYLQNKSNICKPCRYDCMTCSQGSRCLTCDNNLLQTKRTLSNTGKCNCPSIGFYDDKVSENIVCQKCDSSCQTCNGPRYFDCLSCTNEKQLQPLGFCACKNSFVEDSAGNCGCNPPRTLINNICVDPNAVCSQNQTQQLVQLGKRCLCKTGFIQVKNNCIKCGKNAIFNQDQLSCKCVNKTVLINGQCVPCNSNQIFDEISQICICRPGTFKTDQGTCITCPLKMSYLNGNCQCIYNYYQSKPGVCSRCLKQSDGPKCQRVSY